MKLTRTLGMAILALLALSALGAPAAQAAEFGAKSYPATFFGAQGAAQSNEWTMDGSNKTTCGSAKYQSDPIAMSVKTLTIAPVFASCSVLEYAESNSKLEMNGCKFELLQPGNGPVEGNAAIRCPANSSIRFFGSNFGTCEALVGEQGNLNLAKVAYSPTGGSPNKVVTKFTVTQITVDKKIDGIGCNLKGTGVVANGTFTATVTLEGTGGIEVWVK
jgi:hypothetical protein